MRQFPAETFHPSTKSSETANNKSATQSTVKDYGPKAPEKPTNYENRENTTSKSQKHLNA